MACYIQSATAFTAYDTFSKGLALEVESIQSTDKLNCLNVDVTEYVSPRAARRMSPIIKKGVVSGKKLLAEDSNYEAIIVGTSLGCLTDTKKFIDDMFVQQEQNVSPTPFIQSTHNTIAGQIALNLKCNAYNMTYAQRSGSFYSALLDAFMLVEDGKNNVLVGGSDELTETSFQILKDLGYYLDECEDNLTIYQQENRKVVAGEASVYLNIGSTPSSVQLIDIAFEEHLPKEQLSKYLRNFLSKNGVDGIDAVVLGNNGEQKSNAYYQVAKEVLDAPVINYKHLCGEFHTADAVGTWVAYELLHKLGSETDALITSDKIELRQGATILVYNNFFGLSHSFNLLKHEA